MFIVRFTFLRLSPGWRHTGSMPNVIPPSTTSRPIDNGIADLRLRNHCGSAVRTKRVVSAAPFENTGSMKDMLAGRRDKDRASNLEI